MKRAILVNVGVFEATNTVRRNVAAWNLNYPSDGNNFSRAVVDIAASGTKTVSAFSATPSLLLVRTDEAVTLAITRADDSVLTVPVKRLFVWEADWKSVLITAGATATRVQILQN